MIPEDIKFMKLAIKQAKRAAEKNEVPVGAVIVKDGKVLSRGKNERETKKSPLAHAEILAIGRASKKLGGWRLPGCTLYVTLEPCPMCAGAILNSRIERVVFGAYEKKGGALGSACDVNGLGLNHRAEIEGGVMEEECSDLIKAFFRRRRAEEAAKKAAETGNENSNG